MFFKPAIETPIKTLDLPIAGRGYSADAKRGCTFKTISMDHAQRKQDGGTGSPDNAQLTHPYCNSGYKEQQVAKMAEGGSN